jgi:hypothetical protein
MLELTHKQMETLERFFTAGFRPLAIPLYEKALCLSRDECVAILSPVENGTFSLLTSPTVLINGNPSVRLKKGSGEIFLWKKDELPATPERLRELQTFRAELVAILETPPKQ